MKRRSAMHVSTNAVASFVRHIVASSKSTEQARYLATCLRALPVSEEMKNFPGNLRLVAPDMTSDHDATRLILVKLWMKYSPVFVSSVRLLVVTVPPLSNAPFSTTAPPTGLDKRLALFSTVKLASETS